MPRVNITPARTASRVLDADHGGDNLDKGIYNIYIYIYVVLRGWIKSAARYYISDIYALRRY